jgi:hypothetical protein
MHIFSSRTHYTWIPGEELWEVNTTSKDYQQEEIFESAVLDESQELEFYLVAFCLAKQDVHQTNRILCQFVGENCVGVVGRIESKAFM